MKEQQRQIELGGLPAQVLFDLARNPSADPLWRKAAVRLMLEKGYPQATHEDLAVLVMQVRSEKDAEAEVESLVEAQVEHPVEELANLQKVAHVDGKPTLVPDHEANAAVNALAASFTTRSMQQEEVIIRNPAALADDALTGE